MDTVRSCIVVTELFKDRMEEWKDDEKKELVADTCGVLDHVIRRCNDSPIDSKFFPASLMDRLEASRRSSPLDTPTHRPNVAHQGVAASATAIDNHPEPGHIMSPFDLMLSASSAIADNQIGLAEATVPRSGIDRSSGGLPLRSLPSSDLGPGILSSDMTRLMEDDIDIENRRIHDSELTTRKKAFVVRYVTWNDAWIHAQRLVTMLSEQGLQTRPAVVVEGILRQTLDIVSTSVNDLCCRVQQFVNIPRVTLVRRSALRWRVYRWPSTGCGMSLADDKEQLELDLTNL